MLSRIQYRTSEVDTKMLTGSPVGGIPPGLIPSFWYGGGIFRVIAGCAMFGAFLCCLQKQDYSLIKDYPSLKPVMLYVFHHVGWFINSGDLSVFLKGSFHIFVFVCLILTCYYLMRIRIRLTPKFVPCFKNLLKSHSGR